MKRLSEEQKLIKYHMEHGEAGWQSRLAAHFGKSENAIYCAAYRLMDEHKPHKRWRWNEKLKIVKLREDGKTFSHIADEFKVSPESVRRVYYWMVGK